jgi:hypothetical protein
MPLNIIKTKQEQPKQNKHYHYDFYNNVYQEGVV